MKNYEAILPVREFADRGLRWLLSVHENVREVIRQVSPEIEAAIDFSKMTVNETSFIPASLRKQECDVLVRVPFNDPSRGEVWIYILIELQSTPCPIMPKRVLGYILQVWDRQERELRRRRIPESQWRYHFVLPVLLYTGTATWDAPLDMAALVDAPTEGLPFVPRHDMLFLDLKRTDPATLTRSGDPFGWVLRVIQKEGSSTEELAAEIGEAVGHIDQLPAVDRERWEMLTYYLVVFIHHRVRAEERPALVEIVNKGTLSRTRKKEVTAMHKTSAEALMEEGEARGMIRAKREALLKLMRAKFGEIPTPIARRIRAVRSSERLDALLERVLFAERVGDMLE